MPLDAIFLSGLREELEPVLLGARIDKIQQPARDTVLLTLRSREKLLLSANTNRPRIHFTRASFDQPAQPPMFCMLLRKHLTGGRIAAITQPPAERSLDIALDCTDEMGIACQKHLILELMGRNSNLILTGPDGRVIDCLRRVDFEMSEQRQVLPGLFYHEPPRQNRLIPGQTDREQIARLLVSVDSPKKLDKWLLETFAGLSPLIARELCYGFCGETEADILDLERERLTAYLAGELSFSEGKRPVLLSLENGKPKDFSYRPIYQYGSYLHQQEMESFSALLDAFYTETDRADRMRQKSQTLRKTLTNLYDRAVRKLELQKKELAATLDREHLRRLGDIVTANLHSIERGQLVLRAVDFYDEEMKEIEIPLKPDLSPQQNAAKFYKDYAKAKTAEKMLTQQIQRGTLEAEYLAAVLESLNRAENERDLSEIRTELEEGGYLRPTERKKAPKNGKPAAVRPLVFRSSEGFPIYVGRNNRQNDQLTFKIARKDDLWFHVQKFHGAHVVIASGGVDLPDETVTEAAMLAALYSEASEGQNVPVDVTPVRFLKKPNGAKPGMVVYERYRTVIVTPDPTLPERLKEE
ncbi:MAG: NFACT family protein [Oscillospiraceae bacterium]|nr:NFACT family protein [Oscillospiraceae bacterium]